MRDKLTSPIAGRFFEIKNPDDGHAMRAFAWILLALIRISKREVQKRQVFAGVWGRVSSRSRLKT
ncbi:MAG: hypothetical protein ACLR07_06485 [Christensenellales bacterium]